MRRTPERRERTSGGDEGPAPVRAACGEARQRDAKMTMNQGTTIGSVAQAPRRTCCGGESPGELGCASLRGRRPPLRALRGLTIVQPWWKAIATHCASRSVVSVCNAPSSRFRPRLSGAASPRSARGKVRGRFWMMSELTPDRRSHDGGGGGLPRPLRRRASRTAAGDGGAESEFSVSTSDAKRKAGWVLGNGTDGNPDASRTRPRAPKSRTRSRTPTAGGRGMSA